MTNDEMTYAIIAVNAIIFVTVAIVIYKLYKPDKLESIDEVKLPNEFIDNTDRIIKRCKLRKRRAADWPKVTTSRFDRTIPKIQYDNGIIVLTYNNYTVDVHTNDLTFYISKQIIDYYNINLNKGLLLILSDGGINQYHITIHKCYVKGNHYVIVHKKPKPKSSHSFNPGALT